MRSLIVVTILCLISTPAFACVFHTDCNPGATCEDGVCSDQKALQNQNDNDSPSSNANDNALTPLWSWRLPPSNLILAPLHVAIGHCQRRDGGPLNST